MIVSAREPRYGGLVGTVEPGGGGKFVVLHVNSPSDFVMDCNAFRFDLKNALEK